jgi:hypothetical protein
LNRSTDTQGEVGEEGDNSEFIGAWGVEQAESQEVCQPAGISRERLTAFPGVVGSVRSISYTVSFEQMIPQLTPVGGKEAILS